MQFARHIHSNTTLKGEDGRMEIEYLKKKINYVQVSQLSLSKIVDQMLTYIIHKPRRQATLGVIFANFPR